ncbi:HlyD family secretion protein [Xanthomonas oryzae]|uniref:HlyD family secretion protein n=1 Tax=Xanthomonas oryzae TaxID=347 RepID=UPI002DED216D|nr:HlyD family efflux transporter periplasmic adaptor subunit [Xanthomonas oryzae pv. oryzicola]MEC5114046.1 HlyD family efflux transporter periplasmic adaptor subunit [Xanthomonas oryzae pv. oryzicola]
MSSLFRTEAVEARRQSWLGGISLVQPVRFWVLAFLAFACAAMVVVFIACADYTRRSRVSGELVPDLGLSTIVAQSSGVIEALKAEEGDYVNTSDPLVVISVPRVTANGDDALKVLRRGQLETRESLNVMLNSERERSEIEELSLIKQRETLQREISMLDQEIATRAEQVRIGQSIVGRYRQVADQRYVSLVQLNQQEQSVLDLLTAEKSLRRQSSALRRTLMDVERTLAELPQQRAASAAQTTRDLASLSQESVRVETDGEQMLRAPVGGLVASRIAEVGQAVQAGQPIMSLLPKDSHLRAQLLVPSAAVGFIKPGDKVLLRYEAYPYQKFGSHIGRVLRVSRSSISYAQGRNQNRVEDQSGEPVYRVIVSLEKQSVMAYGQAEALRPGLRVEADILGERRKIYEWILEPLYSVTGKVWGA